MANEREKQPQPDDDIPEMTAADFKRAKPMRKLMPQVVKAMKRGRPTTKGARRISKR